MPFDKISRRLGGAVSSRVVRLLFALSGTVLLLGVGALALMDIRPLHFDILWNLFLALIPLGLSVALARGPVARRLNLLSWVCLLVWLVFYPNAPYMVTDLIHLGSYQFYADGAFVPSLATWLAFAHLVVSALVGCACGWLSLYLVHKRVRGRVGAAKGWLFCGGVALLSGVAIFIGRFLRFNSWDLLHRPLTIVEQLLAQPLWHTLVFSLLFAALTLGGYLFFYLCFDHGTEKAPA